MNYGDRITVTEITVTVYLTPKLRRSQFKPHIQFRSDPPPRGHGIPCPRLRLMRLFPALHRQITSPPPANPPHPDYGDNAEIPPHPTSQTSSSNPGTSAKSSPLQVISVSPSIRAVAAIMRSMIFRREKPVVCRIVP
jgi:hypothetical protein